MAEGRALSLGRHDCPGVLARAVRRTPAQLVLYRIDGRDTRKLTEDAPVGNWTWRGPVPREWKPTYTDIGATRKVVLHIYDPVAGENIYRATDTYPAGSYDGKTETTVLCGSDGGFVY